VAQAEARRFTLLLWGVITLPLLFAGFVAVVVTGAKIGEIHREARAEMRARSKNSGIQEFKEVQE
jgi:hypothetical protein